MVVVALSWPVFAADRDLRLVDAAKNQDARTVAALIRQRVDVNVAQPDGATALHWAAQWNDLDTATLLIKAGASVAVSNDYGVTPLWYACVNGSAPMVDALLKAGASPNVTLPTGETALMFAAREGDIEASRLLLEHGANINAEAADGSAVLLIATVRGHTPLSLFLLDKGANVNADRAGYTALHWASGTWESSHTHDYKDVERGEWSVLVGLPLEDKVTLIKALLAKGADVNARITRAPPRFGWVLFKGKFVLGATPFYLAAITADLEVMQLLLSSGATPLVAANDKTTTLHVAAGMARTEAESLVPEERHLAAVKVMLELGADINAANDAGNTALHAAAMAGFDTVAQYLVDKGITLNAKNRNGDTALKLAEGYVADTMLYVRTNTAALLRKLGGTTE